MKSGELSKSILDERDFVSYTVETAPEINEAYYVVYGYDNNTEIVFLTVRNSCILHKDIVHYDSIKNQRIYGWATYCRACGLDSQYKYCYKCFEVIKDKKFMNMIYMPLVFDSCEYVSYINKEKTVYKKEILITSNIREKVICVLYVNHTLFGSPVDTYINFVISKIDNIPYKIPTGARVEYNLRKYTQRYLLMRELILEDLFASTIIAMIE